jgi:hypothetical protein
MAAGEFDERRRKARFCALLGGVGARDADTWHTADGAPWARVCDWWGATTQIEYKRALQPAVGAGVQAAVEPVMAEQGAGAPEGGVIPIPGAWLPPFIGVARFIYEAQRMRRHHLRALRESAAGDDSGAEQGIETDSGSDNGDDE